MNILYVMIYLDQNNIPHKVRKLINKFQNEVIGNIIV
jgi:hypothetical protein